ncbi:MAG: acetamidase/formamidase family protein [Rhodospirillaceae bacterium]|jgi:acetamidase/formamidase|nr:acetamidase/formamidase family protein [Rhodospirillaceae bacterium]MBT4687996.1 acetamidase/formamidase family protein [Rhodospirillaceae bacterium]MBT5083490.1 acetamidase/formamidase family protein [Rhodospirillaceae bacterium]MBT5527239.1 acetamidase/formamidase family protein [Rhodospirillaceae bacterium]MBT5879964.1 acetamidase/formamidase family protein [Rhodospirillaceae bacterium]
MNTIVEARPDTVHWGYFEAARPGVAEIASGDRVTIRTISGAANVTPSDDSAFTVAPEQRAIHTEVTRQMLPGHILTGPVAVKGAQPGMVLEVRIIDIELGADWGWNIIRPGSGALPDDFSEERLFHIALDKQRQVGTLPWGQEVPLAPFFGVMGVAPSPDRGTLTSIIPGDFGGNMDLKELIPGTILYLPIFVEGGHFSVGDGHAAQGDGEVCVTAIETGLNGSFDLIVRDDMHLTMPRAETPSHHITMGINPDLDEAARQALREMIKLICERTERSREEAYTLCSICCDLRVTQLVNQHKGVHAMLLKDRLT